MADREPDGVRTLSSSSKENLPLIEPVIAGKYKLVGLLGSGGFAWVFRARHTEISSLEVAIKVLRAKHAATEEGMRRFRLEADAAAKLTSRFAVNVMDMGETEFGNPFIVMEYVRGVTLDRLLHNMGTLREADVARFALNTLEALDEAHEHGLIHRDLKPSNVFIVKQRGGAHPIARVIDFGIAKIAEGHGVSVNEITVDGSLLCTPKYASPELLRGKPVQQSDLYALGIMMAQMLDGDVPSGLGNSFEAAARQLDTTPLQMGPNSAASPLAPVIQKALAKSLRERYATARDMANDVVVALSAIQARIGDDLPLAVPDDTDTSLPRDDESTQQLVRALKEAFGGRALNLSALDDSIPPIFGRLNVPPPSDRTEILDEDTVTSIRPPGATPASSPSVPDVVEPRRNAVSGSLVILLFALVAIGVMAALFVMRDQLSDTVPEMGATESPSDQGTERPPAPTELVISEPIRADATWTAELPIRLTDVIYVDDGATLTIEPGVTILGDPGSALVVTQDATIDARGRPDEPIVFTSARAPGDRRPGDWGGVVLLGSAPVHNAPAYIEGLEQDDRGIYGGDDMESHCGTLEYVRIEFAGYEAYVDNELNGLTLGGCGSRTVLRHLQVHRTLDDGVEMFGGTVNLSRVLVTQPGDDGFDWDAGWAGYVQFLVVQQSPRNGDSAFEGDNSADTPDLLPRSAPTFYNVTLIGARSRDVAQRAITVRRGSGGTFRNFVILGQSYEAVDVRGSASAGLVHTDELSFDNGIIAEIGPSGTQYFTPETGPEDDDGGFDESAYFMADGRAIDVGTDPMLPDAAFDPAAPDFVPAADAPLFEHAAGVPQGEFWNESARFLGAIRPGSDRTWMDGWTAFPEN